MENIELIKAEQQLVGYAHAKDGYNITSLISGMGLTRVEWDKLRPELNWLGEAHISEIDLFLSTEDISTPIKEENGKDRSIRLL